MSHDTTPDPRVDLDAKLEAEIEEALGDMSLDDMLDYADRDQQRKQSGGGEQQTARETKKGTVVSVHGDQVFVEFGPKSQGICPVEQFDEQPKLGEQLEFMIDRFDADDGLLILSRRGAIAKASWENLQQGQTVEARCTGTNKGGLEMEIAGHRAFMPAGQVDIRHIDDLSVFVGEKMPCEIIELDRKRNRIILSRKKNLEAERAHLREKLLQELKVGDTKSAVVTSLQPYGAFADLGGLEGLIHISDLSHTHIKHPKEVVSEGDTVQVKVLKMDTEQDPPRLSLGLKQLQTDPYMAKADELAEGDTVSGKVTRIMPYGAFVEIAPGVEGLVHISELAHERIGRVEQVVKKDEIIKLQIKSIDKQKRRISLSRKALQSGGKGGDASADNFQRDEDAEMRKLKAQLSAKFGDNLKGGLG